MFKKCNCCNEEKSLDNFFKNKSRKDGHDTWCKECAKAYNKKYFQDNKERRIEQMNKSRKSRLENSLDYAITAILSRGKGRIDASPIEIKELYLKTPYCNYCGKELGFNKISIDHKTPLVKGGSKSIENLTISCIDCNRLKHDKTEQEFKDFLIDYIKRFNNTVNVADNRAEAKAP